MGKLVDETIGRSALNVKVNELLRDWLMQEILAEEKNLATKSSDNSIDLKYGLFCNDAGLLIKTLGDLDKALMLYKKCLAIYEKVHGEEHSHTATLYNNIGDLLHDKGDVDCAMDMYRKALAIREKVLGSEHTST